MKVTNIASATVVIEHNGTRVLCDPWLSEGIYYGSWFHYPPLDTAHGLLRRRPVSAVLRQL